MASLLSQIERVPVESLEFFPGNARRGDVGAIAASLRENEQYAPIVVQRATRHVLAGNHTLKAAISLGWPEIDVVFVDVDEQRARKINLSANRTAELGDYDLDALSGLLDALGDDYTGTGWAEEDIHALLDPDDGDPGDEDDSEPPSRGELMALAGVTVGEPRHRPEPGQIWAVGGHRLVIADVYTGWPLWAPMLTGDVTFLPYPTPLVPHAPDYGPLLMVQPEPFLAGHLLDKWETITGESPAVVNADGEPDTAWP